MSRTNSPTAKTPSAPTCRTPPQRYHDPPAAQRATAFERHAIDRSILPIDGAAPMIQQTADAVILQSRRFRLRLSTAPHTPRLLEVFQIASRCDANFDINVPLTPWTGFAGVTSHTREFFLTTEAPQSPRAEILDDAPDRASVRYGPLFAGSWKAHWTLTLEDDALHWSVDVEVGRKTLPDDEINLLAFDVPPGEEFTDAWFDTGYILPPKDWFAIAPPTVTYAGNEGMKGILDRRVRLKFCGPGHETLFLNFAGGYGLSLTCTDDNDFRIVPKVIKRPPAPRDPNRLPPARFEFKAAERFAIAADRRVENAPVPAHTEFHADVTIRAHDPCSVETLRVETPDPAVAERTIRFHRTHAHGSIAHKWGYAGGWHNTGLPDAHSVSFEYYMHGKAHFYDLHPAADQIMANALDSVFERETHPDGLIWQHGFEGRGAFYENNASMLIFLADYVRRTGDLSRVHYGRKWADYILANTTDDPHLYYCPTSTGRPGFGRGAYVCNWWDVVGCGGYDAFINVLTVPGLRDLAELLRLAGDTEADRYARAAERFRESFNERFWDDRAGRYVSWVDADNQPHDYFFTAVNLIAAAERIADSDRRRRILESIDTRLAELGYRGFSLPGNLIAIPPEHYNAGDWWLETYGCPHFYDPFGTYENGGIWPWVSAYYIAALAEFEPDRAYAHYTALLDQYDRDNLQGAGNGYFWNPDTGELTEGSKQEPYLANSVMAVWGFFSLFGVDFGLDGAVRIAPRLPQQLDGASFETLHHARRLRFTFNGHGTHPTAVHINNTPHEPTTPIPPNALPDRTAITINVTP
jgi:hypothetical protein